MCRWPDWPCCVMRPQNQSPWTWQVSVLSFSAQDFLSFLRHACTMCTELGVSLLRKGDSWCLLTGQYWHSLRGAAKCHVGKGSEVSWMCRLRYLDLLSAAFSDWVCLQKMFLHVLFDVDACIIWEDFPVQTQIVNSQTEGHRLLGDSQILKIKRWKLSLT